MLEINLFPAVNVIKISPQAGFSKSSKEGKMSSSSLSAIISVLVLLTISCVEAWDYGDVVPVTAFVRIDGVVSQPSGIALPIANCPRFGTNKIVQLPALFPPSSSSEENKKNDDLHQISSGSNIAIRFEIGRGLKKSTKWITVRQSGNTSTNQATDTYLTMIHFQFGFQMGVFNRVTSFKAYATHSDRPHEIVTLKFDWDEHRAYNPHRALSLVAFVCLILGIFLFHRLTRSAYGGAFHSKSVIVHDRTD